MKSFPMFPTATLMLLCAATAIGAPVWSTDFGKAQAKARGEGKILLVNFSGSDWCGWCMKLRKDVFQTPVFAAYAQSNLVLLEVDFPKRKALAPAQEKANLQLAQQFQVQGFPTIILIDAEGTRLGTVNYANGGPRTFIAELEKIVRPPSDTPRPGQVNKKPATPKRLKPASTTTQTNPPNVVSRRIATSKQTRHDIVSTSARTVNRTTTAQIGTGSTKPHATEISRRSLTAAIPREHEKRQP